MYPAAQPRASVFYRLLMEAFSLLTPAADPAPAPVDSKCVRTMAGTGRKTEYPQIFQKQFTAYMFLLHEAAGKRKPPRGRAASAAGRHPRRLPAPNRGCAAPPILLQHQRMSETVPFLVTEAARVYEPLRPLPVSVILDNFRSLYNVGSLFRTADAAGVEKLYLCGITGTPPQAGIRKTALGAELSVPWERRETAPEVIGLLRERGYEIAAVETGLRAVDLFDWTPAFPVCLLFGNEKEGLAPELLAQSDTLVRIPMLGRKNSLNVATAAGVVVYELLRKYRKLAESYRPL